ncbi:MAG: ribonuclease PH [Thermoanaerobaculia bacterium]
MSGEAPHRVDGRAANALRPVTMEMDPLKFAEGSVLIKAGDTQVLVAASVENRVPGFLSGSGKGWITAEYSMLPRATSTRSQREVTQGRPSGRTAEIQRLIGRSLRAAFDLRLLGERTLMIDCDVLQADAGTRTASVTGAWVAATSALAALFVAGDLAAWPVVTQVAAVSVGVVDGQPLLDLDFREDQRAAVDLNLVATAAGDIVEIQGTGEQRSFARAELDALVDLGLAGVAELAVRQREALGERLAAVEELRGKTRKAAPARSERGLWNDPPERA